MTDGQLRSRNDVGGRCVHNHDPGGGGGLDINVVEAHSGTSDDLQVWSGRNGFFIHLGGAANENGVGHSEGFEQRRPVCSIDDANVKIGAEGLNSGGGKLFSYEDDRLGHVK